MRRMLLALLAVVSLGATLSGCFCPYYWHDYDDRGYRYDRGRYDSRDYDGRRDRYRDSR